MKKLILSCSLIALTLPAYAADTINCATLPTCDDLGYTENASDCLGRKLLCPFDKTQAACLEKPKVGDLKYSLYSTNHDGWLRCDGRQYKIDDYQQLYDVIKLNFCHKYTSRTDTAYSTSNCDADYFAVPDYRGFFLRGYVSASSAAVDKYSTYCSNALYYKGNYLNYNGSSYCSSFTDSKYIPQYERLPSITGRVWGDNVSRDVNVGAEGAFSAYTDQAGSFNATHYTHTKNNGFNFDASRSSPIYDGSHVVPANYAAYIFIYAGQEE